MNKSRYSSARNVPAPLSFIADIKQRLVTGLAVFGLVIATGMGTPATAATPDDTTPANEGVCDVLKGGTPGLYGLCVAYCEAQDLDTVGDKEAPNNKILRNYNRKKQATDPDMPCIKVPCPCWDEAQLAAITDNITETSVCEVNATVGHIRNFPPTFQFAVVDVARKLCRYTNTTSVPPRSLRLDEQSTDPENPDFDPRGWETCYSQIAAACP